MAEVGIAVAAKAAEMAAESVADSIATQLGYIWNYDSNFQNLEQQVKKLQGRRDTVQHWVDEESRDGKEIEQHVRNWINRANRLIDEAAEVKTDNNRANMRCLKSWCPDLKKRYQHSKKAAVKAMEVSGLEKEGNFDRVSYRNPPKEIWHPSSKLFEDFESRRSTVENILKELRKPNVNMVGVYGMGGIGKTTLAKEVGKQTEEQRLFETIVFVEVSEKPDIMKIQGAIADKLRLEFREESESGRARNLWERLKKESRILLILDNIWKGLDLEIVGIPIGNDHPGCKLLLTARSIDVLSNEMNSLKNFPISNLNENEAENLFREVAGACIEQYGLQDLASQVAKRCGGLPVAVVTIAKALKDKQVHAWRNALQELEKPSPKNLVGSVTAEAYSCIQLSYNHLETDELKQTFLLCSTIGFTSYASVENLLRYGMGLNLFEGVYTMEEARDRVYTLVQKLKDSSLLLDTPVDEQFSIHDVVRDVGRAIAISEGNNFIVDGDDSLPNLVVRNSLKNCTSIFLLDIGELPEELNCPEVKIFYMKTKTQFSIPSNFFERMPNLEVLHLILMELSPLPASLRSLTKLRTLYLNWSNGNLGDIAIIGDIKNLEILVLSQATEIKQQLPEDIGQLKHMRLLDLRNCSFFIPPNIISRLTQLEELYMGYWYDQQQVEDLDIKRGVASLEELTDLSGLTALDIHVVDAEILPKGFVLRKLKRYKIYIGGVELKWSNKTWREPSRTLTVKSDTNICSKDGVIKELKGIEDLCLDGEQRVNSVLSDLDGEGFPKLKHFVIRNNPCVICIVDSLASATCDAFPLLETLSLSNLASLEKICHDQLTTKSFCQLRTIKVVDCGRLKNLFSFSIAKHLSQLQEIEVVDCGNMEEIFIGDSTENGVIDPVFINQLHSLTLGSLPKLRRIFHERQMQMLLRDSSSNEIISEGQLDALPLFGKQVVFPNLKNLKLDEINLKEIWPNQLPSLSCCVQSLTSLIVSTCSNLEYMFSLSTLGSFKLLQHLVIKDCKNLEELIRVDDKCSDYVEFPSLEKLSIQTCPHLRKFIFNDKVSFPSLQEIIIEQMENLKMIWQNQLVESVQYCPKLCKVSVNYCQSLENLFPASIAKSLLQLEQLNVRWCDGLKEIVAKEELVEEAGVRFAFPQLTSLSLSLLRELKCFYHGKHITEWPKLNELKVTNCRNIDLFNNLQKNDEESKLNVPMQQPLFVVDKVFANLKKMTIDRNRIIRILQSQFSRHLCPQLKFLEIENDESSILSLDILESFHNLEELKLSFSSYKEIFSYEEVEKYAGTLGKLKCLHLYCLVSLRKMWKQDPKMDFILQKLEILEVSRSYRLINLMPPSASFENLKIFKVSHCDILISLVAASTAKSLVQLEEMSIKFCREMTEIIANEGDVMEGKITFTRLKSLELYNLRNLTSFCSGNYSFNFPLLEKLTVNGCPKIQFFSSQFLNKPKLQIVRYDGTNCNCEGADLNTILKQNQERRVFPILEKSNLEGDDLEMVWQQFPEQQKVFSNAKEVHLVGNGIQMILRSQQFPKHIFPKLKLLEVWNDNSTVFPFGFFQTFHNMKEFVLARSSYEEIFSHEELEKHTGELPQIKCLHLRELFCLEEMWKPNSKLDLILQNLEMLKVESCQSLINVLLPSSSFENLKVLTVMRCERLMSLSTVSIAKSLVLLEEMQICNCKMMTKVIANEGDATENEIIFHKLKKLELEDLSNLTSFSSENDSFKFPLLEKLVVRECPNMKIFSSPDLSTPMLREVWQDETNYICENDLNKIIQQHFEDMVFSRKKLSLGNFKMILQKFSEHEKVFSNLEQLSFSGNEIKMIWENQFLQQYLFPKLKLVEVSQDASTVSSLSILERFQSVEELELNCCSYEEIFSCEDVEKHARLLPKIKKLSLYRLYDLAQLWKRDSKVDLSLPNLEVLLVERCGSLVSLMPPSTSFRNLTYLIVWGCHRLRCLVAPSTAKSLVQLNSMTIMKCNMMTEVISSNEGAEAGDEIIFSKLWYLTLDRLSSLSCFCSGNYTFNFPSLKILDLNKCPKIKFFSSGVLNTPGLEEIRHDDGTEYFCDGDLNASIQGLHKTLNAKTSPEDCAGPSTLSTFSASSSAN